MKPAAALATAIVAVALPLLTSPTAGADADQFLRDVAAEGWSHERGPNAMLADGYQVCAAMDQGATIEQVTLKYLMPMKRMTSYEKARVLDLMLTDLCPNHAEAYHNWLKGG
ncbi:DUF732 domain-containing protein [Mycobacterium sp. M1]|uniref:DUF732 domain-containing protein n=1 Tax=Mycolicibacter acidiphilus TaxID=2835306 RepID=A0ABS5RF80_9MYCO|nr:DUF732 domain-containing protein [Mycolicibacter acidiphilus]MBS9532632.1 DUF732 domain-containing protein [Mycolicibacter acidiphilus]